MILRRLIPLLAAAAMAATHSAWAQSADSSGPPTVADAEAFIAEAERTLAEDALRMNRFYWVNETYITEDTDALAAEAGAKSTELGVRLALEAARFSKVPGLPPELARKLDIMRGNIVLPAPTTPGAAQELSEISTGLTSAYGMGKATLHGRLIDDVELDTEMGRSRNPDELLEMWASWHDNVGRPMKKDYARLVEIANAGARELGFADVGTLWRSGYDMPPAEFAALTDKLWSEVKPLYDDLHCYTRAKLNEAYGDAVQPATGPIKSHLLGNIYALEWSRIYDLAAPAGAGDIGYDTTDLLVARNYDAVKMFRTGEAFFSSLGFAPLPETFWTRSMLTKPADREVVCHASAWSIDMADDLRIKMCTKIDGGDFVTAHHELGHIYYDRAYKDQPYLYREGANDGFHEAIGDMVALSLTPDYLVEIGLLDPARVPSADKDIGLLLRQAMERVAFLPYGLLVDKWRWGVFDGSIPPADYNKAWDRLRLDYQGVVPPVARDADAFDPGAKYHIPATTPYMRYFLAYLLEFQFYEAACREAGWTGPLHRCTFYGNKAVGEKLNAMLSMGASKPWPDALEVFTGSREISGKSILAYFAPLQAWLKEQNKGRSCGW